MIEPEDLVVSPSSDATSTGNDMSLSERNSSIEKKEPENFKLYEDNDTVESTSTHTTKKEEGTFISSVGDSIVVNSENNDQNGNAKGEGTMGAVGRISPAGIITGTPEVDAFPNNPDIDVNSQNKNQNETTEGEGSIDAVDRIPPTGTVTSEVDASPNKPDINVNSQNKDQNKTIEGEGSIDAVDRMSPAGIITGTPEVDAFPNTPGIDVNSQNKDKNETTEGEGSIDAVDRISPTGTVTSEIDAFPNTPDMHVDTNVAAFQSQRIEPEGATPTISKASLNFDDAMLDKVLSESRERQEDREKRIQQLESEDAITIQEENVRNEDVNGQNTIKKKPKEPPGTPAKHERKKSETSEERERRIKHTINSDKKELPSLVKRQVDHILLGKGGEIEEKKGDDEISIQIEPSGSSISLNKLPRDTLDDQVKQPENMFEVEKLKEMFANDVEKIDEFYESPTHTTQPHALDFNNNHNVHAKSHVSNQPQTYNDNMHQNSHALSPALFYEDDEGTPIPHLPPLIMPGIGPSYDSMSVQGQGQQLYLGHNSYQQQFHQRPSLLSQQQQSVLPIPNQVTTMSGGKRKIHLRLWEDVSPIMKPETSSFLSFGRKKGILRRSPQQSSPISKLGVNNLDRNNDNNVNNDKNNNHWADRGTLTVSWYEGTSSLELQEHVQNSVIRKLGLRNTTKLLDFRVLDESSHPPEEIVLSPYIPNGSRLIVRFTTTDVGNLTPPKYTRFSDYSSGPPDSPSAAPSPYPTSLDLNGLGLNANQLALLGTRLDSLQGSRGENVDTKSRVKLQPKNGRKLQLSKQKQSDKKSKDGEDEDDTNSIKSNFEVASLHPEDPIQKSLRDITSLLLRERGERQPYGQQQEKRQVIFVLANYFVLFLSLIAISAEIQARAPNWHAAMEQQLNNVHDCSKDKESLFTCVENGDMAGLVASVVLFVSRSAATKRIFLLGFGSPNKLWTAVYESLVTAICWGFSYMFIRRGMNPDNNRDFLRRYWKDAVYGSLAGFNAAFMKQVLKNLIPQEAIEDALQERQLKILSWLPSIG